MNSDDAIRLARVRHLTSTGQARAIRLAASLSVEMVARAVGVAPVSVWRWESSKRKPSGREALAYLDLLQRLLKETV